MILFIAWKNIWRNKARSIVIMSAISIGLFGGIFSYAFMMGGMLQRVDNAIKNETSSLQLHSPAFLLNADINNNIAHPELYLKELNQIKEIKGSSDRLKSTAMISTSYASFGVVLNGVFPDKERQVTKLYETMMEGEYLKSEDQIPIVIGRKLAKKLNAEIGDKLVLSVPEINGDVAYGAFILKGIYNTENDMFDGVQAYIKKDDLASLVGVSKETTSEIAVSLYDTDLSEVITKSLQKKFASEVKENKIVIRSWKEIDPTLNMMIASMDYFSWLFVGIILLALAFGIVNTMLMVVLERVREIGMLMAIGMNKLRIFMMIMWETIFLSITGGIVGMLISAAFIAYFQTYGLDLSAVAEGMNAYGINSIIYPEAPFSFYVEVSFMIMITAILASIYPALKALSMHPAEAIRE